MTNHKPTDLLGESISRWDAFYNAHFTWIYQSVLELMGKPAEALKLTQKIFLNFLLTNPELVLSNDQRAFESKIGERYPDLKAILSSRRTVGATQLVDTYYNPN